jgi:hypothetical protein
VKKATARMGMTAAEYKVVEEADHFTICQPSNTIDERFALLCNFINTNMGTEIEVVTGQEIGSEDGC